MQTIVTGYYVMQWGADRYTSVAWFKHRHEAEKEVKRIRDVGAWRGLPPIIEPSLERML